MSEAYLSDVLTSLFSVRVSRTAFFIDRNPMTASSTSYPFVEMVSNIANSIHSEFTEPTAIYQFLAIALAMGISLLCSRSLIARLRLIKESIPDIGLINHFKLFLLHVLKGVLFSCISASLLALSVLSLKTLGVIAPETRLVFVRLSYSILYAWALLLVLLNVLSGMISPRFFGPFCRRLVSTVFWILAFLYMLGVLSDIVTAMKQTSLPIGSADLTLWAAFVGLLTVICTLSIANWLAHLCETALMSSQFEPNIRMVLARLSRVALMVLAVLIALSSVGINLTILSVFGGAVGVGIGFGMQKIASNYISGFIILFDRSVKIGDLVEVAGFSGIVTRINTRYSVIRNLAGEEVIVPNETFVTSTIKNFSFTETDCLHSVMVSVAYESDITRAQAVLLDILMRQDRVLKDRKPSTLITNFGADGVDIKGSFWVKDPEKGTGVLKSAIMKEILVRFAEEGIEIPYAKREVKLSGSVELRR